MGQFRALAASLPRLPLNMASINGLPENGVRASTGVYVLFRRAQRGDPPQSIADGYTCLKVARASDQLLGPTLADAFAQAPRSGATHFSYIVANLELVIDAEHRRLYVALHPLDGDAPEGE